MKRLHVEDLYCWSQFQDPLDLDFNGFAIVRPAGNVLVDPMPLSAHDAAHLEALGGAAWIVLTNSFHVRAAVELSARFGAKLAGPAQERERFPVPCARWLADGDEVISGLVVRELDGSKTPGELALVLDETTLIAGDLLRARAAGSLHLLPPEKLQDAEAVRASLKRLLELHPKLGAVLVGDGWCLFDRAIAELQRLAVRT